MVNILGENLFLVVLGLVWIIGAVLQDLRRREVDNIWNFSLIAFVLVYRGLISIFNGNGWFLINGLIGLGVFFLIGNLFYYSRLFAGGDVKLLMGLGAILPLSYDGIINLKMFGGFILLFLVLGSIYSLIWALILVVLRWKEFSKEWKKQWKEYKKWFLISIVFVVLWGGFVIAVGRMEFIAMGVVILLFPLLFLFAKAVEESCMVKKVNPRDITEGEILYKDVRVKGRIIKASWQGLSNEELKFLRKHKKKIWIKIGIPFTPGFLLAFLVLVWFLIKVF